MEIWHVTHIEGVGFKDEVIKKLEARTKPKRCSFEQLDVDPVHTALPQPRRNMLPHLARPQIPQTYFIKH